MKLYSFFRLLLTLFDACDMPKAQIAAHNNSGLNVSQQCSTSDKSEKGAARALGYTQVSWDNVYELQPWSSIKPWIWLTYDEKEAALFLGYSEITWDDKSGLKTKPNLFSKKWKQLTGCGKSEHLCTPRPACSTTHSLNSYS